VSENVSDGAQRRARRQLGGRISIRVDAQTTARSPAIPDVVKVCSVPVLGVTTNL